MQNRCAVPIPLWFVLILSLAISCSKTGNTSSSGEADSIATNGTEQTHTTGAGGARNKRALLIGINDYKYPDRVPSLAGSINDVEDMKALLIGKFEFPPENVLVLKGPQATHAGIINAIKNHLIAKAGKDDIVVFHYSGHGSQMKDVTGKRINALDETIVPYDSRDPAGQVFDISGAELHGLLLQLAAKTKNITFILDSCHSGTLVRGARVRNIPADVRTPPARLPDYAVQTRALGQVEEGESPKYALIAGATSRESAFEHFGEGKEHGALTYFLVRQLRNSGAGATYRDIMDNVIGNVTANYPAQHPQLEGAVIDQYVFGDSESLAQSYVLVSSVDASQVTLDTGEVQGASADSVYDLYKPGTKKFEAPEEPIGRVRIRNVGPFASEGTLISGTNIPRFARGIEREHSYGRTKLNIYFDGPESSPRLRALKSAFAAQPYLQVVSDPAISNLQIREADGKLFTLAADGTELSPPLAANDPKLVDLSVQRIKDWAKWFSVLGITNSQSAINVEFSIMKRGTREVSSGIGKSDLEVPEGEPVEAIVKNNSMSDVYISLLDLSSDGTIAVAYPPDQGASEVLQSGKSRSIEMRGGVPNGRSSVVDILKVFVSSRPINLAPLTGGPIRSIGADSDPLQVLLNSAAGSSRSVTVTSLGSWATAQRVIVVRRK